MHILVIPSWYATAKNPVKGSFFLEQALALQNAGHQVTVLAAPSFFSRAEIKAVRNLKDIKIYRTIGNYKGIDIYTYSPVLWAPGRFLDIKSMVAQRLFLRLFSIYLKSEGMPDIIHAHSIFYAGTLSIKVLKKYNVPIILTEHNSAFLMGRLNTMQKKIVKSCLHRFSRVIAVGPTLASKLNEYEPKIDIQLIGNMVDHEFFIPSSNPLPQNPFIFIAIAFLTKIKNFSLLIRAFARAFKGREVFLKIGGDGEERDRLEMLSSKLGVAGQIEFLGALSRTQVRDSIQKSHALVSSSDVETFGVTLIEALACGKPVVATKSGGPEMFVNKENGVLVPACDVEALADAMTSMRHNYDFYNPSVIRNNCIKEFSAPAIVSKLENVYAQALSGQT